MIICFSDVLSEEELHLPTMDHFSLLCGTRKDLIPSALLFAIEKAPHLNTRSSYSVIHFVNDHYIVSSQDISYLSHTRMISTYDTVFDKEHLRLALHQMNHIYMEGNFVQEYFVPQFKRGNSASGLFAAAHIVFFNVRGDPCHCILD